MLKCPKCQGPLSTMRGEGLTIDMGPQGRKWNGVAYCCPKISCQHVISVQIDPIAVMTDTVNRLMEALKKR